MKTKAFFAVFTLFLLNSCGGTDSIPPPPVQQSSTHPYAYRSFSWQTSGGGNLSYSIAPPTSSGGSFTITITASDFQNQNQTITISSSDPLYTDLQNLFSAKITIESRGSNQGLTGTWNKIIIIEISGKERVIQSPDLQTSSGQALNRITDYVRQQAQGGGVTPSPTPIITPIDDGGILVENCKGIYDIAGTWRVNNAHGAQAISVINPNEYYRQGYYGDQEGLFYTGYDQVLSAQGQQIGFERVDYYHFTPNDCQIYQVKSTETRRGRSFKIISADGTQGRRKITLKICEDHSCSANRKGPEQTITLTEM